jgi:hypothetical protein
MKRRLCLSLIFLLLFAAGASQTAGQAITGLIVGNVNDSGGAAIAGARATMTEARFGFTQYFIDARKAGSGREFRAARRIRQPFQF